MQAQTRDWAEEAQEGHSVASAEEREGKGLYVDSPIAEESKAGARDGLRTVLPSPETTDKESG